MSQVDLLYDRPSHPLEGNLSKTPAGYFHGPLFAADDSGVSWTLTKWRAANRATSWCLLEPHSSNRLLLGFICHE